MLKKVASYLGEKEKLEFFKYNLNLQKHLDINIINYIEFAGKYKIGGKNGKGKEYNGYNDALIFEGEYLNGKRNGKGKEYYFNGDIKFEGEYSNGLRNGKGKEFNFECKVIFEGEYKNGNRWTGKIYDNINNNIYEIYNGKWYLKEYSYSEIFEGQYLNGKKMENVKNIIIMVR